MPDALSRDNVVRAWSSAVALVSGRPWLTVSRISHEVDVWHLVVHDGEVGPSLHFDDDAGPTFAGKAGVIPIGWEEIGDPGAVDWVGEWGPEDVDAEAAEKVRAYRVLADMVALGPEWSVSPARFIDGGDDDIDAVVPLFPSARASVDGYWSALRAQFAEGEGRSRQQYWHDPLWLVRDGNSPFALVDESGQMHGRGTGGESSDDGELKSGEGRVHLGPGYSIDVWVDVAAIAEEGSVPWSEVADRVDDEDQWVPSLFDRWIERLAEGQKSGPLDILHFAGIRWTVHATAENLDLLSFLEIHRAVGFYFGGGRLVVDRFGIGPSCDYYVTRGSSHRFDETRTLRLGSKAFPQWRDVVTHLLDAVDRPTG